MRTQMLKGAAAATAAGVLALLCAPAQAADVNAKVPFTFSVNKKALGPGTYHVATNTSAGRSLIISGFSGGAVTLSTAVESTQATAPKLVFHRYGEEYILREVWMGNGSGHQIPEPARERELARARGGDLTARFERVEVPIL